MSRTFVALMTAVAVAALMLAGVDGSATRTLRAGGATSAAVDPPADNPPPLLTPEQIERNIAQIQSSKDSFSKMMDEVQKSIARQEMQFEKERVAQTMAANASTAETAAAEQDVAKVTVEMVRRRRRQVNACLKMLRGGSNKLYWDLRDHFARAPPQRACNILKAYEFPKLPFMGFTARVFRQNNYAGPNTDGTTIQFYDAVKQKLFACMCEEVPVTHRYGVLREARTPSNTVEQAVKNFQAAAGEGEAAPVAASSPPAPATVTAAALLQTGSSADPSPATSSEKLKQNLARVQKVVATVRTAMTSVEQKMDQQEEAFQQEKMAAWKHNVQALAIKQAEAQVQASAAADALTKQCLAVLNSGAKKVYDYVRHALKTVDGTDDQHRCGVIKELRIPDLQLYGVVSRATPTPTAYRGRGWSAPGHDTVTEYAAAVKSHLLSCFGCNTREGQPSPAAGALALLQLRSSEDPPSADTLKAQLDKIESEKESIVSQVTSVTSKIQQEEQTFDQERAEKKEAIRQTVLNKKVESQGLKLYEQSSKTKAQRRTFLVRGCLNQLRGGKKNKIYWELRDLFAKTPAEEHCSILKAFKFPKLHLAGYKEKIVGDSRESAYSKLSLPPMLHDGSEIVDYGDAVKIHIFRCMCEERSIDQKPALPVETPDGANVVIKTADKELRKLQDEKNELVHDPLAPEQPGDLI